MKKGDLFPVAAVGNFLLGFGAKDVRVQYTGKFREPKQNEWYISGAIPEGYQAFRNLTTKYHIGKLVKVRITEIVEVIE